MTDDDHLRDDFLVIAAGTLPRRWYTYIRKRLLTPRERAEERNALLIRAARLLEGSEWDRAGELAEIVRRVKNPRPRDVTWPLTAQGFATEAVELDPDCPDSQRHIWRIIEGH